MLPSFEGLDPGLQSLGTIVFVILVGAFTAWSLVFGKKPKETQTKEFAVAGQLADMGPVKELVEQTGLLVQQQIRTNIFLERCAVAMEKATTAYEGHLAAERNEAEIEAEVERRLDHQLRERRSRARRQSAP